MNSFHLFLIFSVYVFMLLWVFLNKLFLLLWNDLWNVNLESKDYKTLSTHSLVSLSSKFWYQLLTMNLSIIIKFETINNLFMWSQNMIVKTKTETTLTLETLDFIHESLDLMIRELLFWIFIKDLIFLSSKMRVINKVLRKRKTMVNTWIRTFHKAQEYFDRKYDFRTAQTFGDAICQKKISQKIIFFMYLTYSSFINLIWMITIWKCNRGFRVFTLKQTQN